MVRSDCPELTLGHARARGVHLAVQVAIVLPKMMSEAQQVAVEALLGSAVKTEGGWRCTFVCPLSGRESVAVGMVQSGRRELISAALVFARRVQQRLFAAAAQPRRGASEQETRRAACLDAFEQLRGEFVWQAESSRWVSAAVAGVRLAAFAQQLKVSPVVAPSDRRVLARMLAEIATADGVVAGDERDFVRGLLGGEFGSVEQIAEARQLTPAELRSCTDGPPRQTMLMLAWAVALADQSLAAAENLRLQAFAEGLGIDGKRARVLKRYAQEYLVDQVLEAAYALGRPDPAFYAEAIALAQSIGLDASGIEGVEQRLRQRLDLNKEPL